MPGSDTVYTGKLLFVCRKINRNCPNRETYLLNQLFGYLYLNRVNRNTKPGISETDEFC